MNQVVYNLSKTSSIQTRGSSYIICSLFQSFVEEKKPCFLDKKNVELYIRACVKICWLMSVQDPPVVLDTKESDDCHFDTDRFKPYTKTGKTIDYVVWPPLMLSTAGSLLSKGVAQGK